MSRGPQNFRQRDVAAAIKAARQAGIEVARVKIEKDGTITIITRAGRADGAVPEENQDEKEWR